MPEFDWDDLRVFLALHRGRSVRAASRALRVSHSTISRRIDGLEAAMGARLFDRLPSGFTPTPAGEAMLERAERVETDLLGLEREITGRDARLSGPIRVSLTPIVAQHLLMPHLAAFAGAYPDIEMRVSASYEIADLGRREADVAVRFSAQPDDHLVGRRLPDFADAAFATPDYVAAHRFEGPNAAARWIGWDDVERSPKWVREGPHPDCRVGWQIPDPLGQVAAARAGVGMAYLPCFVGDRDPKLVRVPPGRVLGHRPGWILTHPDLRTTLRVRRLAEHLADAVRSREALIAGEEPAGL